MKLTDEEILAKSREMAVLMQRKTDMEEDKKKDDAKHRGTIKDIKHKIARLAWAVRTGEVPEEEMQRDLPMPEKIRQKIKDNCPHPGSRRQFDKEAKVYKCGICDTRMQSPVDELHDEALQ